MRREAAARRYAQAAFEIALARNELDAWASGLRLLEAAVADAEVLAVLTSSQVRAEYKERLLETGLKDANPLVLNLSRLLVSKGRIALAGQIREEFDRLVDAQGGIAHASVTTAVALSDDERAAVEKRLSELTGQQVKAENEVDPEIVGGLVARVGDRLIDGSTRARLRELKRDLAGAER